MLFRLYKNVRNCSILDFSRFFLGQRNTGLGNNFTAFHINCIFGQSKTGDTIAKCKFFIKFITSYFSQIVSSHIKEHTINKALGTIDGKWLARTQFFVQFQKTILIILRSVFRKTCNNFWFFTEQIQDLLVCSDTEGTDQHCDRHFTVTVYTYIENVIGICLILKPCTTVWNDRSRIQFLTNLIMCNAIIDSRRTNQLAYDNTLSTIDNKSTGRRHKRQVAHENIMLTDLFCLFIMKSYLYFQRCCIRCITFFASFN